MKKEDTSNKIETFAFIKYGFDHDLCLKDSFMLSIIYRLKKTEVFNLDNIFIRKLMSFSGLNRRAVNAMIHTLTKKKLLVKVDNSNECYIKNFYDNENSSLFKIYKDIIDNKYLSLNQKLILCFIRSYAEKYDGCSLRTEDIADKLHLGLATVNRNIKELKDLNLITSEAFYKQGFVSKNKLYVNNINDIKINNTQTNIQNNVNTGHSIKVDGNNNVINYNTIISLIDPQSLNKPLPELQNKSLAEVLNFSNLTLTNLDNTSLERELKLIIEKKKGE